MVKSLSLLAAGLVALLALACSGDGGSLVSGSDEDQIRAVTEAFQEAFNGGDPSDAYDLISEADKEDCSREDFSALILFAKAFIGDQRIVVLSITEIEIDGDQASALVVSGLEDEPPGEPEPSEFVKEDGRWRIDLESGDCGFGFDDEGSDSGGGTSFATAVATVPVVSPTSGPEPSTTATATPVVLSSRREASGPVSANSGGVRITIDRLVVAGFPEFVAANEDDDLAFWLESEDYDDAITIGWFELTVENSTDGKITVYPGQGTVVVGTEQVDTDFFLSDDLGGDYFAGVVKEGRVFFVLTRLEPSEVGEVLLFIDAPWESATFDDLGPDYELRIALP
jgi:hypothetical protein